MKHEPIINYNILNYLVDIVCKYFTDWAKSVRNIKIELVLITMQNLNLIRTFWFSTNRKIFFKFLPIRRFGWNFVTFETMLVLMILQNFKWIGSTNQKIIFLKFEPISAFQKNLGPENHSVGLYMCAKFQLDRRNGATCRASWTKKRKKK